MLSWKLRKRQILPLNQNISSVYFQVSVGELQPFCCHDLANAIYSQTAKTVFSHLYGRGISLNLTDNFQYTDSPIRI